MAAPKFFYGWVIAGASWLNQGLGYSVWYSFPVFFVALIQEFDWDRGSTAGVYSVFVLLGALAGPLVGWTVDRYGPRTVLPLGAMLTALGVALCAYMDQQWQFYLSFGVIAGLGLASLGMVPNNAALSRWFVRRLGSAAGLASTGVAVGIFVAVPLLQAAIERSGWRTAYLLLAATIVLVLVPLNLLLQRSGPGKLGLEPDGEWPSPSQPAPVRGRWRVTVDQGWADRAWTLRSAAGTVRFWMLFGGLCAASFAQQLLIVHQVMYLIDAGQPAAVAASIAGIAGAFAVPAKVICGVVSDRYGREVAFTGGTLAYIVAFPLLVFAAESGNYSLLFPYAALVGVGLGTIGPIAPGMVADLFAGPSYGSIFGAVLVSTGIGAASGAWFAGSVFDATGDYRPAFIVAVLAATVAIALCWLAAPPGVRRLAPTMPVQES